MIWFKNCFLLTIMSQEKFNLTWHTYTDHLREMLIDIKEISKNNEIPENEQHDKFEEQAGVCTYHTCAYQKRYSSLAETTEI